MALLPIDVPHRGIAMASAITHRRPRILILHGMKPGRRSFSSPIVEWYEDLGHRGLIEPIVLGASAASMDNHPPMDAVNQTKPDGIVTAALYSDEDLSGLLALKVPLVVLDHEPLMKIADSVGFDNVGSARQLGQLIIERGHKDILYVSRVITDPHPVANADPRIEAIASQERRGGLMTAMEGTSATIWGMLPWHSYGAITSSTGSDAKTDARFRLKKLIAQAGRPPDCVVAVDFSVAEEMHALIQEFGWRVPEDVSLATFRLNPYVADDPSTLKISHMSMDYNLMAEAGWQMLSARLKKGGSTAPIHTQRLSTIWLDFGSVIDRRK